MGNARYSNLDDLFTDISSALKDRGTRQNTGNWKYANLPITNGMWTAVKYGTSVNRFVAISGFSSNKTVYSSDGINWSSGTLPTAAAWYFLDYGLNKFIAVSASGHIAYSNNGINWTLATAPQATWASIAHSNTKFVALAGDTTMGKGNFSSNIITYSSDGINWTQGTLPESLDWLVIGYVNGKFIVLSTTNKFAYSSDGINWSIGTFNSSWISTWYSMYTGGNKIVAVGSNHVIYSNDGLTWGHVTIPKGPWHAVTYGTNAFMAITSNTNNDSNSVSYAMSSPPAVSAIPDAWEPRASEVCAGMFPVTRSSPVTSSSLMALWAKA